MNCGVGWNLDFLFQNFAKVFLHRDLKTRREQQLLEREKAMLPATVPYAEEEKRKERIMGEIEELNKQKDKVYEEIAKLDQQIRRKYVDMGRRSDVKEKREFIRACPSNGCKGFLSTSWKCGLCNVWVCPHCHEVKGTQKDAEHTCDPEILKTAKLLDQETRPCPTCASLIYKIDGCDQMFCTSCLTAFSWKTGKVEKGTIHNPHYFEYMRKHGNVPRTIGDVPCGGVPSAYNVSNKLKKIHCSNNTSTKLLNIVRCLQHIETVEIPGHRTTAEGLQNNLDLRVSYLLNRLDEEQWKKELQRRERKDNKNIAHRLIFDMILAVGIDLVNRCLNSVAESGITNVFPEFDNLREHCNTAFIDVGKQYNRTVATHISDQWFVVTTPLKNAKKNTDQDE